MEKQTNVFAEESERRIINIYDIGQAETIVNRFKSDNPGDEDGLSDLIVDLLNNIIRNDKDITGSADNFHNFAVTVAKIMDDKYNAMLIISKGLKRHPKNTDLLADALLYGYNTKDYQKDCQTWYDELKKVDMSLWTWRAFSFSIDYLIDELNADYSEEKLKSIIELAHKYQEYKPENEDAWISESDIYRKTNKPDMAKEVLEKAIEKFKVCPKCWLRYADLMQESGYYDEALKYALKIRRNPSSTNDVNMAYVYYLEGLCRYTLLIGTDEYDDGILDEKGEKEVIRIYKAFSNSKNSKKGNCRWHDEIDDFCEQLFNDTGIENRFEDR